MKLIADALAVLLEMLILSVEDNLAADPTMNAVRMLLVSMENVSHHVNVVITRSVMWRTMLPPANVHLVIREIQQSVANRHPILVYQTHAALTHCVS